MVRAAATPRELEAGVSHSGRFHQALIVPGNRFSHYTILEELGRGGTGSVFKAQDCCLGRFVALKVLHTESGVLGTHRGRLLEEGRLVSGLDHPNVVTVYEAGFYDGREFLAMEWIRGKTLDQVIQCRSLSLRTTLKYSIQIATALAAAHGSHILHRDLKPRNVMITESGDVKLLDFGLATRGNAISITESDATQTMSISDGYAKGEGRISGTLGYISPELLEGKGADERVDIFSFGAVLYEMLTGRPAFQGDSLLARVAATLRSEPEPVDGVTGAVPQELQMVVDRCLQKDPNRRYQTIVDVKHALERLT